MLTPPKPILKTEDTIGTVNTEGKLQIWEKTDETITNEEGEEVPIYDEVAIDATEAEKATQLGQMELEKKKEKQKELENPQQPPDPNNNNDPGSTAEKILTEKGEKFLLRDKETGTEKLITIEKIENATKQVYCGYTTGNQTVVGMGGAVMVTAEGHQIVVGGASFATGATTGSTGNNNGNKPKQSWTDRFKNGIKNGWNKLWGKQNNNQYKIAEVDPNKVRFSQDSIKNRFRNGQKIDALVKDLKSGKIKAKDIKPIRVVEKNGKLYSLDNRRLQAFKEAGIKIRYRKATPQEIKLEWQKKFQTKNDGISIRIRGANNDTT